MNSLNVFKSYSLKASSILESAITITIISTCILIGTVTYAKVFEMGNSMSFYKAKYKMSELLLEKYVKDFFQDEVYEFQQYNIHKKIEVYNKNPFLRKVSFTIKTFNKRKEFTYILNYHFESD